MRLLEEEQQRIFPSPPSLNNSALSQHLWEQAVRRLSNSISLRDVWFSHYPHHVSSLHVLVAGGQFHLDFLLAVKQFSGFFFFFFAFFFFFFVSSAQTRKSTLSKFTRRPSAVKSDALHLWKLLFYFGNKTLTLFQFYVKSILIISIYFNFMQFYKDFFFFFLHWVDYFRLLENNNIKSSVILFFFCFYNFRFNCYRFFSVMLLFAFMNLQIAYQLVEEL